VKDYQSLVKLGNKSTNAKKAIIWKYNLIPWNLDLWLREVKKNPDVFKNDSKYVKYNSRPSGRRRSTEHQEIEDEFMKNLKKLRETSAKCVPHDRCLQIYLKLYKSKFHSLTDVTKLYKSKL